MDPLPPPLACIDFSESMIRTFFLPIRLSLIWLYQALLDRTVHHIFGSYCVHSLKMSCVSVLTSANHNEFFFFCLDSVKTAVPGKAGKCNNFIIFFSIVLLIYILISYRLRPLYPLSLQSTPLTDCLTAVVLLLSVRTVVIPSHVLLVLSFHTLHVPLWSNFLIISLAKKSATHHFTALSCRHHLKHPFSQIDSSSLMQNLNVRPQAQGSLWRQTKRHQETTHQVHTRSFSSFICFFHSLSQTCCQLFVVCCRAATSASIPGKANLVAWYTFQRWFESF